MGSAIQRLRVACSLENAPSWNVAALMGVMTLCLPRAAGG